MTRSTRLTFVSALSLGLMACGGGAKLGGGKDGAAQAAFQASQPTGRSQKQMQALLSQVVKAQGATLGITINCRKHGSTTLGVDLTDTRNNNGGVDGAFYYSVKYSSCNEDGRNEYDGTLSSSLKFAVDPSLSSFAFITTMKGKLDISGDVSDSLDTNLTLRMNVSAVDADSGKVEVYLDGTIKTSDGTYTYTNEKLDITAGVLPHL